MEATATAPIAGPSPRDHGIPFGEALRVWAKVAAISFGGPAGQIAMMHRVLVEERRWIGEERFLHALNYCMLLPGPEAQQLAIYIGWLLHKTKGGLVAGALFVLPGLVAIMALSWVYALFGNVPFVEALFFGLKAAVLAIVLQAVVRIGSRSAPRPSRPRARVHALTRTRAYCDRPAALRARQRRRALVRAGPARRFEETVVVKRLTARHHRPPLWRCCRP